MGSARPRPRTSPDEVSEPADARDELGHDEHRLRGLPISFHSTAVERSGDMLAVNGSLAIAGEERPASFQLKLAKDGRVSGKLTVTQSDWGIKPYRAFMGALKVRDAVEVTVDVRLPTG